MRTLLIASIVGLALVAVSTSTSAAAESNGQIPASMLADLGVGGMQYLTDAQGMEIRGKGTKNGNCIPRCAPKPSCEKTTSCERQKSCETKTVCVPKQVCRPKCSKNGSVPG